METIKNIQFSKYRKLYLEELKKFIKIETYLKEGEKYPTKKQKEAIEFMADLGTKYGFKSYADPKGYYGYIDFGSGKNMFGILGHVDVVPPGNLKK